ncbi:MAG: hypothetical protein HY924_01655 [Elusimicrobia bacterium]|nr:hypothetical protein [Elusimicrobiota bacterium]
MTLISLLAAAVLGAASPALAETDRRSAEPAEPDFSAMSTAPVAALEARTPAGGPDSATTRRIWLTAHDDEGKRMDFRELLSFIGRADAKDKAAAPSGLGGLAVYRVDTLARASKAELLQAAGGAVLVWEGPERVRVSLPWPVRDDGFSTVWIDKGGDGYADRDTILFNEEIALTQHRRLGETLRWKQKHGKPPYTPGDKTRKLLSKADDLIADAKGERDQASRAKAFDKALTAVSAAWQKMAFEHGAQAVAAAPSKDALRFGLTLDESAAAWTANAAWLSETIDKAGADWARLVFRANPHDFAYASERSFEPYDAIVSELNLRGIKVMACPLDTAQWPRNLTPEAYAARVANLVRRYSDRVRSWEVGPEINGDWLGGSRAPLGPQRVFEIFSAGAAAVKAADPALETVATLYWWDGTAPDEEHSLYGWLDRYLPQGFGKNLDVVSLSLQPEDNPVGMAFDEIFRNVSERLPDKKLMLGSFGYVEGDKVKGYWWLDPEDVDGGRKDLVLLYTAASCGQPGSLCGGFWWQTLDQMLLPSRRTTDLFLVYKRGLYQLGR